LISPDAFVPTAPPADIGLPDWLFEVAFIGGRKRAVLFVMWS